MSSAAVSVIIPTFNRAGIVNRAVQSALAAVRSGDEVIVVDDGSTDNTEARLGPYAEYVRYIRSAHIGPGAARNLGVRAARCPLVAFLDSDDEWMPDKLELQRAVLARRPDVLFCFSDFGHRTRAGVATRRCLQSWHRDQRTWDEILGAGLSFSALGDLPRGREDFRVHIGDLYLSQMRGDYVCTSTVVARREESGVALQFAEDVTLFEDWQCFGRLSRAGRAAYLDVETQWNCDRDEARLTRVDRVYAQSARLTVLERVWGRDPEFLAQHGEAYRQVLRWHRGAKARALLAAGRTREARAAFRLAGEISVIERMLAAMPGSVTRAIVAGGRRVRLLRGSAALRPVLLL